MKIYINGNIYDDGNYHEALVEDKGKIIYVGSNEIAKGYGNDCIDLEGNYVLPGFNDSHMHLLGYGQFLANLDLSKHTSSLKELLAYVKDNIDGRKWVIGRGWNHDYFSDYDGYVTKDHLDSISKDVPIFLTRACGHVAVVNSKAIELINLKEIDGGSYDLNTGLFKENAVDLIKAALPALTIEDIKEYIIKAQTKLNSYGITSVQTDDFLSIPASYEDIIQAYQNLEKEDKLTVKVYQQAQLITPEAIKEFKAKGYSSQSGSKMFKIGPIKIVSDGSLGARTALLSKPYQDLNTNFGMSLYSEEYLRKLIKCAIDNDYPLAIHTIGDKSLDWILKAIKEYNNKELRHGLVHVQVTRLDQLELIKQLKLHCYVQTIFIDYDSKIVEARLGTERANSSYQFKYLYENTTLSNGSDCPVENPDVMLGIQLAITRQSPTSNKPYLKQQALTRKQAINSFTINGAYASLEENTKGLLKVGMDSDFVVINQDIMTINENKIKDIKILKTFINGKQVYGE